MASTIKVLRAVLRSDLKDFSRNMQKAGANTKELARAWEDARSQISRATKIIGASVAAMATAVTVKFAKFESTMKRAGAVTRTLGTRDFARLEQAAKDMGEATVFSASEAAEAIEKLGLAGLETNEIIEALPGALELAAAGGVSIADAADAAAKTMRAFGADAKELSHINDVLVGTFTRANTDLPQLSEAMKHVAPVSKSLGVSLEDTAAIIAKMSDAGFQGSIAGTSLRNIMTRLAGAVPEATTALADFGIITQDSTGKMRPLIDILQEISESDMGSDDLLRIFGARGGPQLLSILEAGIPTIREFSQALEESGGIAKSIAEAQLDTLAGAWKLLQSRIESFMIEAGEELAPMLREMADGLQDYLEEHRTEIVESLKTALVSLADVLSTLGGALGSMGPAMADAIGVFAQFLGIVVDLVDAVPGLMEVLIALRISAFLGLTSAVKALVMQMGLLGGATASAGAAAGATAAAGGGFAALFGPVGLFVVGAGLAIAFISHLRDMRQAELDAAEAAKKHAAELKKKDDILRNRIRSEADSRFGQAKTAIAEGNPQFVADQLKNMESQRFQATGNTAEARQGRIGLGGAVQTSKQMRKMLAEGLLADIRERIKSVRGTEDEKTQDPKLRRAVDVARQFGRQLEAGADVDEFMEGWRRLADSTNQAATEFEKRMAPTFARQDAAAQKKAEADARVSILAELLKEKRQGMPGFDRARKLIGQPGVNTGTAQLIGQSMEGSTKETAARFAQSFKDIQSMGLQGAQLAQALDQIVEFALEDIKATQEKATAAKERAQLIAREADPLASEIAGSSIADALKLQFQEKLRGLSESVETGAISAEIFKVRIDELKQSFDVAADAAAVAGKQTVDAFTGGFGGGGGGGRQLNRIGGDALSWTSDIAKFFGSDVKGAGQDFRNEVEKTDTRPIIQKIFDSLAPSPHPFVAVSGEGGPGSGVGSKPGAGGVNLNVSVQKMTDADIRRAYTMLMAESNRRGRGNIS